MTSAAMSNKCTLICLMGAENWINGKNQLLFAPICFIFDYFVYKMSENELKVQCDVLNLQVAIT